MALLIVLLHEVTAESPSLRKLRRTEYATSPDESSVAVVDLHDRSAVKKEFVLCEHGTGSSTFVAVAPQKRVFAVIWRRLERCASGAVVWPRL
jgi:hypothetical protein